MKCFPFMHEIEGARAVLIGGGKVALHKAQRLAPFGVELIVCAHEVLPELKAFAHTVYTEYAPHLLDGASFAIAATDDRVLNARIASDCRARHIPVNCVDDKEYCDFFFPALIVRGEVSIGVSTGGASPLLAALLRDRLARALPENLEEIVVRAEQLRAAGDREAYERELRALLEES